jgi:hypothetical protein
MLCAPPDTFAWVCKRVVLFAWQQMIERELPAWDVQREKRFFQRAKYITIVSASAKNDQHLLRGETGTDLSLDDFFFIASVKAARFGSGNCKINFMGRWVCLKKGNEKVVAVLLWQKLIGQFVTFYLFGIIYCPMIRFIYFFSFCG